MKHVFVCEKEHLATKFGVPTPHKGDWVRIGNQIYFVTHIGHNYDLDEIMVHLQKANKS